MASNDGGRPFDLRIALLVAAGVAAGLCSSGNESKDAILTTDCLCSRLGADGIDIRLKGRCVDLLAWWYMFAADSDAGKLTLEGDALTRKRIGEVYEEIDR